MARFFALVLLLLSVSFPALAKPKGDTYPVPCNQLWDAVTGTLGNPGNYTIMAKNDDEMTASFTIVGAPRVRMNTIALSPRDAGCEMKVTIPESGIGNSEEGVFRSRVKKSLDKLNAVKPAEVAKPAGSN